MTSVRWRALLGLVSAAALLTAPQGRAADNAAHSIADKFAHDTDGAPAPKAQTSDEQDRQALERKLDDDARLREDEKEMLERAKAERAERAANQADTQRLAAEKAEGERKAAEEAKRIAEEKRRAEDEIAEDKAARERAVREAARIKQAAEAKRVAEEQAAAKDREIAATKAREDAARIKQAEDAKRLAEEQAAAKEREIAATKAREEAARIKQAEDAKHAAEEQAAAKQRDIAAANARIEAAKEADAKRLKEAEAQQRMTAEREEEARRLSEKLTRAREQRAAKLGEGYSALGNPPEAEAPAEPAPAVVTPPPAGRPQPAAGASRDSVATSDASETRATILLVMEPGSKGIRRYEKTADPIICIGEQCYVGSGTEMAATEMARGRALGPGNTLGQRAGACRHSLVCVFRDVPVGHGRFELQPIDMRILRHDRRETASAEIDRTCTAVGGYLRCAKGVNAATYRVWIVPESVARKGGTAALSAALSAGLTASTAAELRR